MMRLVYFAIIFDCRLHIHRDVVFTQSGQPFIIAGSGTLGWDQVGYRVKSMGMNSYEFLYRLQAISLNQVGRFISG